MDYQDLISRHHDIIDYFKKCIANQKLVHAYLFESDSVEDALGVARYFASLLLCSDTNKPCGQCSSCIQINNNSHINVNEITKEKNEITKDQIISIQQELNHKSVDGSPKVYIFVDGQNFNNFSSNSLLKILEEPFENHYLIIITNNLNKILPTMISRCQLINFKPIQRTQIDNYLIEHGFEDDFSYSLSHLCSSINDAINLSKDETFINIYQLVIELLQKQNLGKNIYIEYSLKGKLLFDIPRNYHHYLFQMLIIIKQEHIRYLETKNIKHFNAIIELSPFKIKQLVYQIETISHYQEMINAYVNLELVYSCLFMEL